MEGSEWEIEEEQEQGAGAESSETSNLYSNLPIEAGGDDDLYVAVGKPNSSMGALSWALKHIVKPSTFVYLIHVFPEVHHIPTPLGMLPKSRVSLEQVESFMSQERARRETLIQKFLNLCHSSQVQVDTILIESDLVAKAILELIPVLNIRRIIVGSTRSRKQKKANSTAEKIFKTAPQYCEVKIVCDGKEVVITNQISESPSPHPRSPNLEMKHDSMHEHEKKSSVSCTCFSRKFM